MKSIRRVAVIVLVNLALIALVLEAAGNVLHWRERGRLFYGRPRTVAVQVPAINPFALAEYRPVIHPYFGYVYVARPGVDLRYNFQANNHSFIQRRDYVLAHPGCCDFPVVQRDPDEAIIGIFGGSVAGNVAHAAQAEDRLARLLAGAPRFAGKRIRVLSFAVGGHKQPQQLAILAYYLSLGQKLDAIVDVDGFNEVVFGHEDLDHGIALTFPTPWLSLARFLSDQRIKPDAGLLLAAYHDIEARTWNERADRCRRFATCYLFAWTMAKWHALGAPNWSSTADVPVNPDYFAVNKPAPGDPFEQIADNWAESLALMAAMAQAHGTPFVAMIQPNQWFRATTPFKPRTQDGFNQYAMRMVPPGYRALIARIPRLRERGVTVLDPTKIFDALGNDIYEDDCCHFVAAGNAMLVDEIARWLAAQ